LVVFFGVVFFGVTAAAGAISASEIAMAIAAAFIPLNFMTVVCLLFLTTQPLMSDLPDYFQASFSKFQEMAIITQKSTKKRS
jgi:hypothetical protein